MKKLEELTKDELIDVIALMHDTVEEWSRGFGLPIEYAEILNKIGSECLIYSLKYNNLGLAKFLEK
jgi:hypothetical protein